MLEVQLKYGNSTVVGHSAGMKQMTVLLYDMENFCHYCKL